MEIRNPKIAVIGASSSELAQIKVLLAAKNIDLVELTDEEVDATVTADWILDKKVVLGVMPEIIDMPIDCTDTSYDDGTQHWRGGSRGKGGKIKYARK